MVADVRSPLATSITVIGTGAAGWQFSTGHTVAGFAMLAIVVLYLAHPGAAIGSWLGARDRRR